MHLKGKHVSIAIDGLGFYVCKSVYKYINNKLNVQRNIDYTMYQWIGLREMLPETPIVLWENPWFTVKIFPSKPIHWWRCFPPFNGTTFASSRRRNGFKIYGMLWRMPKPQAARRFCVFFFGGEGNIWDTYGNIYIYTHNYNIYVYTWKYNYLIFREYVWLPEGMYAKMF